MSKFIQEDKINDQINLIERQIKLRKKQKISLSNKQKRTQLILKDSKEINNEHKREFYDRGTKYKKSLKYAKSFNEYINNSRKQFSNYILKRKIKSVHQREPMEKEKGFYFNVSFMPTTTMFNTTKQEDISDFKVHHNQEKSISQPTINLVSNSQQNWKYINISLTSVETNYNNKEENNSSNSDNNVENKNKYNKTLAIINMSSEKKKIFNANSDNSYNNSNQHHVINTNITSHSLINDKKDWKNINIDEDNSNMIEKSTSSIVIEPLTNVTNQNSKEASINYKPLIQQQHTIVFPSLNQNKTAKSTSLNQANTEYIKYIIELYKTDHDKLKKEIGINEFNKLTSIVKNLNYTTQRTIPKNRKNT